MIQPTYQDNSATVYHGDARDILASLPAESVHVCITSPPYFGLRKYAGVQPSVWDDPGGCEHQWGEQAATNGRRNSEAEIAAAVERASERGYDVGGWGATERGARAIDRSATGGSQVCLRCGAQLCCLGLERTPADYVRHLVEVFRAVKRVLRPDGTAFVNIGSSYAGSGRGPTGHNGIGDQEQKQGFTDRLTKADGMKAKCDLLIPDRLRIALVDDGWIVRVRSFPWIKRSCMPGSQRDRATVATEDWVMLSKQGAYLWDETAVRREHAREYETGYGVGRQYRNGGVDSLTGQDRNGSSQDGLATAAVNPAGRSLRTTDAYFDSLDSLIASTRADLAHWERIRHDGGLLLDGDGLPLALDVVSKGSDLEHYAAYPEDVVTPFVLGGTSEHGCCKDCGAPWERVTETSYVKSPVHGAGSVIGRHYETGANGWDGAGLPRLNKQTGTLGWRRTCTHENADRVPAVVLDPFLGSGTTAVVAKKLGRRAIGVDASEHYVKMAARRLAGTTPALAALAVPTQEAKQLELMT